MVTTAIDKLQTVEGYFRNKNLVCESAELGYVPLQTVTPSEEDIASLEKLLETFEENPDVQRVWNNLN